VVLNGAGTGPLQNVIAIDAGDETTCALMANHTIRCWGSNGTGTVGDGTGADQELPRAVRNLAGTGSLTGVTQISIGGDHGCARLANGQLRCWGYNSSGQVGDGTRVNRWRPKAVRAVSGAGNLTGVAQVSAGEALTCARLANSQVRCWGRGADGGLGTGNPRRSSTPKVVKAAGGGNLTGVAQVDAGYSAACARLANGRLRCWGLNDRGQSGDGTSVAHHYLPVVVKAPSGAAPLSGATQLAFTDRHGCVRLGSGEARCWGYGASGDLGDGNANDSPLPVVVNA
jgi:alpha-tubulin suppressor-like RCC1 family protein